jgi:hypothetical protein
MKEKPTYQGFEQGPIRPPSEASSLLIRITRNCPWNRCTFCPVYKDARFSKRPIAHVLKDIDTIYDFIAAFKMLPDGGSLQSHPEVLKTLQNHQDFDLMGYNAALNWYHKGMQSIFLQDADSLMIKPQEMLQILIHLKDNFPDVARITSYARSRSIVKISDSDLKKIHQAGLNRIHIGLESGHESVLELVKKGVTPEQHILAGQKVKKAGMELSEYIMPGLGGQHLSEAHAIETANVLNQINPNFIRLRSLAIPDHIELQKAVVAGTFTPCNDDEIVLEIRTFIEHLEGIESHIKSDHILNLFEDLKGKLPEDKLKMLSILNQYLDLPETEKMVYRIGRRVGLYRGLQDLEDPNRRNRIEQLIREYQVTSENINEKIALMTSRFI